MRKYTERRQCQGPRGKVFFLLSGNSVQTCEARNFLTKYATIGTAPPYSEAGTIYKVLGCYNEASTRHLTGSHRCDFCGRCNDSSQMRQRVQWFGVKCGRECLCTMNWHLKVSRRLRHNAPLSVQEKVNKFAQDMFEESEGVPTPVGSSYPITAVTCKVQS